MSCPLPPRTPAVGGHVPHVPRNASRGVAQVPAPPGPRPRGGTSPRPPKPWPWGDIPHDARTLAMDWNVPNVPQGLTYGVACPQCPPGPCSWGGMSPVSLAMGWHIP